MDWAFEWIKKNGGLDTEEDWGYYSGWGFGTWCNARKQQDRWAGGGGRRGCVLYRSCVGRCMGHVRCVVWRTPHHASDVLMCVGHQRVTV
jgi:hypothetical protein